jgi:L-ascorbate metabolism protein UlaG (beta-lactamase superfamily)
MIDRFALTHVGTATLLLEVGPLRLLTDPVLDPPGRRYTFAPGFRSLKQETPALAAAALGRIDAVLLSHDHHADNLDAAGRALLPGAGRVLTTRAGARRLGGNAGGLAPWSGASVTRDGFTVRVTATPARHGPPLLGALSGPVIGFALEWEGQSSGALYLSGDTVWFGGVAEVGRRLRIGTAVLHLGAVRFPITGPARYTFDAAGAVRAAAALGAGCVIPVHYRGWSHFQEGRPEVETAFARSGLADRLRWLPPGDRVELAA